MSAALNWLAALLLTLVVGLNGPVCAIDTNWANDYGSATAEENTEFEIQCAAVNPTTGDAYASGLFDGEACCVQMRCYVSNE